MIFYIITSARHTKTKTRRRSQLKRLSTAYNTQRLAMLKAARQPFAGTLAAISAKAIVVRRQEKGKFK